MKSVLITGASGGIGAHIAYQFARQNFRIIGTYHRNPERARAVQEECVRLGAADAVVMSLDLRTDESIQSVCEQVATLGGIDVLVNNAGSLVQGHLVNQSVQEIEGQLRTNLEGPIKLTARCLPHVHSCIINIGSTLGRVPMKGFAAYCASKFGLRGFTRVLAQENPQLRVLALHPGPTATSMGVAAGASPTAVAAVIYRAASGRMRARSGSDIWIPDYLPGAWRNPKRLLHRFSALL